MTFLYPSALPDNPTFAPTYEGETEKKDAGAALWNATRDLRLYRDNSDAQTNALTEAYARRNKAIFEASGVQLENPMQVDMMSLGVTPGYPGLPSTRLAIEDNRKRWAEQAAELARDRPELAPVINLDRRIEDDALDISRGAESSFDAAARRADSAGIGTAARLGNILAGGIAGAARDPLQIAALFVGGEIAAPARTVFGRVIQRMLTEAAVNGGVEAGVQAASHDWKKQAGLDSSVNTALAQVGLAAAFGGGFGGLLQGGAEVFRLLGKPAPEALARIGAGETRPGDAAEIAAALGHPLDDNAAKMADIAAEQPAMDAESFGPPPQGVSAQDAQALAAQALREVDDPPNVLPQPREDAPMPDADAETVPAAKPVEPASEEADAAAEAALAEVRGPAPESTPDQPEKPKKLSVWDTLPTGREADGTVIHSTHEQMAAEADRSGYLSDVVRFCQD
jgi:hypothetical protein